VVERVAAVARPEDRAARRQDPADALRVELADTVRSEQPLETVDDADDLPLEQRVGGLHERPQDAVQPRAIPAARQDAHPPKPSLAHLSSLSRIIGSDRKAWCRARRCSMLSAEETGDRRQESGGDGRIAPDSCLLSPDY
jgi:hypothetical protein